MQEPDCDFVWIMDDDTVPSNTALSALMQAAKAVKNDFGFLSSYVQFTDGSVCLMNRQDAVMKDWILDCALLRNGLLRVERATFVSCFVKKEAIIESGLPIKDFFIWGDDTEYTYRLSSKYKCYFVLDSVVIHKMQENRNTTIDMFLNENSDRINRYYYRYRNMVYIRRMQFGTMKFIKYYIVSFFREIAALILKCKVKKTKKLLIVIKAYWAGLFFNPKIEFVQKN